MLTPSAFFRNLSTGEAVPPSVTAVATLAAAQDSGILPLLSALRWDLFPCRTDSEYRHYSDLVVQHCGKTVDPAPILSEATALFVDMLADPAIVGEADFDAAQTFEALVCGLAQECAELSALPSPPALQHKLPPLVTNRAIEDAFDAVPFTPQLAQELELRPVLYTAPCGVTFFALVTPTDYMLVETGEVLPVPGAAIEDCAQHDYEDIPVSLLAYASLLPLINVIPNFAAPEEVTWLIPEQCSKRLRASALGKFRKPLIVPRYGVDNCEGYTLAWKLCGDNKQYMIGQLVQAADDVERSHVVMRDDFPRVTTAGVYIFPLTDCCVVLGIAPKTTH